MLKFYKVFFIGLYVTAILSLYGFFANNIYALLLSIYLTQIILFGIYDTSINSRKGEK